MPYISAADGTRLHWHEWGEGAPMLFLSSLGMASQMWQYQMAAFAEQGFRCIALDRRGHGRSDQPPRGYDCDTFADDIAALIDDLDLDALTLVGHSMAGGEIVRYLSRHGDSRVLRAILIGATTPMLRRTLDNPSGFPPAQFESLWARWRLDYAGWVAEETPPFFVPQTSPALMSWTANLLQQTSLPVTLACGRAFATEDFRREMRGISIPVLLVHGDRDRSAPVDLTARVAAQLLPNCRLVVYEGAPHGLIYTHMQRLHADMLRFIQETGQTTRTGMTERNLVCS
jgi:non-heme chloroperoxidase